MSLDLTRLEHQNVTPPKNATWWECFVCGDYAWLWPGETPPECSWSLPKSEDQMKSWDHPGPRSHG